MMRGRALALFAVAAALVCSCRSSRRGTSAVAFPSVSVPGVLKDGPRRAGYLCAHYWDRLADTAGIPVPVLEKAFANYLQLLSAVPRNEAETGLAIFCTKAPQMLDIAEKYLYDPNSPMRDEDFYAVIAACRGDADEVALCSLNKVGTPAADFEFVDARGVYRKLYDIKADYTVLFFSNPGCAACKTIVESFRGREPEGAAFVNVYIDEDIDAWREYESFYPDSWFNGYDPETVIRRDELYHVRAIPSLYLLDRDKKVIFKDAPAERVLSFFGLI